MFDIRIADLKVRFESRYDALRDRCADYITVDDSDPDLCMIKPTWERLLQGGYIRLAEQYKSGEISSEQMDRFWSPLICLYPQLPEYDAFFLHSVLLEMNGEGFLLTAGSSYGKTTQAHLWQKRYPGVPVIINGDEPIIRKCSDGFRGFGTPFCGTEGFQVNSSVPIHGISWLRHGEENQLERIEPSMAYSILIRNSQSTITLSGTLSGSLQNRYLDLLAAFTESVPAYILTCNQEPQAAETAYEGMKVGWGLVHRTSL